MALTFWQPQARGVHQHEPEASSPMDKHTQVNKEQKQCNNASNLIITFKYSVFKPRTSTSAEN